MPSQNKLHLISLSLFVSVSTVCMEPEAYIEDCPSEDDLYNWDLPTLDTKTTKNLPKSDLKSDYFEPKVSINYSSEQNNSQKNNERKLYCGTPEEDLDELFEVAPLKVKNIVNRLKYPNKFFKGNCRIGLFTGDPGVGKSTLSKAIAYKAGWSCKFITPMDVRRNGRGATAIQLKNTLMNVVNSKRKTVIVLDEANRLLENYNSEHHDTNETGDTLWTFLDAQIYNELIFVIATMNGADQIPEQLQSRALSGTLEIPPLISAALQNLLIKKLRSNSAELDQECSPSFIDNLLLPLNPCSGRDMQSLAASAIEIFRTEDLESDIAIIKKRHLEEALRDIVFIRDTTFKMNDKKKETDIERQERLHKEGLAHSEKLHKEGLDKQDAMFAQQALLNLTMKGIDRSVQVNNSVNGGIGLAGANIGVSEGESNTYHVVKDADYDIVKNTLSNKQAAHWDAKIAEAQARFAAQTQNQPTQQQNQSSQTIPKNQEAQQNLPQTPQAQKVQSNQSIPPFKQKVKRKTATNKLVNTLNNTIKDSALMGGIGGVAAGATMAMGAPVLVPVAVVGVTTVVTAAIITQGMEEVTEIVVEKTTEVAKDIATTAINKAGEVSMEFIHATERIINNRERSSEKTVINNTYNCSIQ